MNYIQFIVYGRFYVNSDKLTIVASERARARELSIFIFDEMRIYFILWIIASAAPAFVLSIHQFPKW